VVRASVHSQDDFPAPPRREIDGLVDFGEGSAFPSSTATASQSSGIAESDAGGAEAARALPDMLRQLVAHEVRRARIRAMHKRGDSAAVVGTDGESAPVVELAAHVKKALAGAGVAAPIVPAVDTTTVTADLDTSGITTAAVMSAGFLAKAAEAARKSEMARKRSMIARAASATAGSSDAAGGGRQASGGSVGPGKRFPVIFKHQEGFTNAVRRHVKWSDFP